MSSAGPFGLPPYPHQRLQHVNSLRLLKLWSSNAPANDIECELIEFLPNDIENRAYEAVSWTWGTEEWTKTIRIHHNERAYGFNISPNLFTGLKALRLPRDPRWLWIDAICIDQTHADEKNHQVPMMAQIYGQATRACVWLGEGTKDSKKALDFIKDNVLKLWEFDQLCDNPKASSGWAALVDLMKRPWFSRRWVVQEIALAVEGILYCGEEEISWHDFADAVSLFVEVETATHRLSEVMKKDQAFNHIPDFFGYVPAFGATLLVEAASNLFRKSRDGAKEHLLSLEYLISSLSVFEATEPRDTVYALLALAKDTTPRAASERQADYSLSGQQLSAWSRHIASKPYYVDYQQPFIEVCRDLILFSIRQSEPWKALDIICRPWAPEIKNPDWDNSTSNQTSGRVDEDRLKKLPSWIASLDGAAFGMYETSEGHKMGRIGADPLVGLPAFGQRNYSAAGTRELKSSSLKFKIRHTYCSMYVEGFILESIGERGEIARSGNIPKTWLKLGGWENTKRDPPPDFWRTVVANRGPKGRNAPTFYPRACKESVRKGMHGGTLEATKLIDEGRCSIVAEFLRRVQAVIWNKRLIRTKPYKPDESGRPEEPEEPDEPGRLGLVPEKAQTDDLICVLYGCSVPVVLRRFEKTNDQLEKEKVEDEAAMRVEAAITIQRGWRGRKRRRRERKRHIEDQQRRKEEKQRNSRNKGTNERKALSRSSSYSEHAKIRAKQHMDRAWRAARKFHDHGNRLVQKYRLFASYLAPVWLIVYAWARRNANLDQVLVSATVGAATLFAMFNLFMSPLLWFWFWITKTFKLRRQREVKANSYYYELIGECYVHGMMDNEAIRYQNDEDIKPLVFELR